MWPAIIAAAMQVGGGIISGISARQQAEAAAKAARQNARMARAAAADARMRGNSEAGRARMKGSQVIGEAKVAMAASGEDPSQGSALKALVASRVLSEADARTIQNNAAREAWGLDKQAANYTAQAKAAHRAGNWALLGGLVGGASSAGGAYYGMGGGQSAPPKATGQQLVADTWGSGNLSALDQLTKPRGAV